MMNERKRESHMSTRHDIEKYSIDNTVVIRSAIQALDQGGLGFIVIVDENEKVIGILTDGDFRRAILKGIKLSENIEIIMNRDFIHVENEFKSIEIEEIFTKSKINNIPVLENYKLIDILTRKDLIQLKSTIEDKYSKINFPVVIMAGGKGSRLDPFTRILPKPLIPIGDKPIIEVIMDEYAIYGMDKFIVSVNHQAKMIKAYFDEHDLSYKITYINEDIPLGTAGALAQLTDTIKTPFFVSNCDIIIKDNYSKIFDFHKDGDFALTLIGSIKHYSIPYGVCEITDGGVLKGIKEKPELDYLVNTGMYLLNPEVLQYIPRNNIFNMTDLIEVLKNKGYRIGVYPVSEKSWIDVGQWDEYKRAVKLLTIE